uniref:uncharacterized protein n=1 Tax=Myxine glutinosa TaxID=7769 RepID=UPI00358FB713
MYFKCIIYFHLLLQCPEQEKTFIDWFYTAGRQKSLLTFWQDPYLWYFFWFVILLPKMLDFLVFWLLRKLQKVGGVLSGLEVSTSVSDTNWLQVKWKIPCFLLKFLSHMKPDEDGEIEDASLLQGPETEVTQVLTGTLQVYNEIMEIGSSMFDLPLQGSCELLQLTAAEEIDDQDQPLTSGTPHAHNDVMEIGSSVYNIPLHGSCELLQLTAAEEIEHQDQPLTSSTPHVHTEVMEIGSSVYDIPLQGSCELSQLMAAEEIDDQDQPLTSSTPHVHNEVMEIGSSVHNIPLQGSCELLQLTAAEEIEDQDQHLTSKNSLLPLEYKPEEEKRNLKKLELPILDQAESCSHPKLMCDIKNVKEKYGNRIVTIRECEDHDNVLVDIRLDFTVVKNRSLMDGIPPFIVRLCFCLSKYIDGNEPTVEFIKSNKKVYSINLLLIERMLKTFLTLRWKMMNLPPTNKTNSRRFIRAPFHLNCKKRKRIPVQNPTLLPLSEQGILLEVIQHVIQNIGGLRGFELLFDSPYIPEDKVLESVVCFRDTCIETPPRMTEHTQTEIEVFISAEVLDLLLATTLFAFYPVIVPYPWGFVPYPKIADPDKLGGLAFCPWTRQNFKKLIRTLKNIPPTNKMAQWPSMKVKRHLEKKDPLAYPLLKWIIESVTIPIVKLPVNQQLPFMNTCHQFLCLTAPMDGEAEFSAARFRYGSTFSFYVVTTSSWIFFRVNLLISRYLITALISFFSIFQNTVDSLTLTNDKYLSSLIPQNAVGSNIRTWNIIIRQGLMIQSFTENQVKYVMRSAVGNILVQGERLTSPLLCCSVSFGIHVNKDILFEIDNKASNLPPLSDEQVLRLDILLKDVNDLRDFDSTASVEGYLASGRASGHKNIASNREP